LSPCSRGAAHAVSLRRAASVGATLLEAAERQGTTVLVVGAYGHSRVRERLFGAVTQHVLDDASIPVPMAH